MNAVRVVAASAVLAVLGTHDSADLDPDVAGWCKGRTGAPVSLKQAAVDALQALIDDPEADGHDTWAELGEDDPDYLAWRSNPKGIQARLR